MRNLFNRFVLWNDRNFNPRFGDQACQSKQPRPPQLRR